MNENQPISEQFRVVAKAWVDADAAANMLEETKTAALSQKMLALGDMPVSRAEMTVKASDEWALYLTGMVNARSRANLLKVKMEYLRMRFQEQSSAEASRRAEMRL
jgi:hypothetical protein